MNASIAALAYLASGVLFILSLRGLSSPETSRRGNLFGMVGMALAIGVTLLTLGATGALDPVTLALIAGGVIVGGLIAAAAVSGDATGPGAWVAKGAGVLAVTLASVNIFGGFMVTRRMLAMYKKKERPAPKAAPSEASSGVSS